MLHSYLTGRGWRPLAVCWSAIFCAGVAWAGAIPAGPDSGDQQAGNHARGTPAGDRSHDVPFTSTIRVGEGGVLEASAVAAAINAAIAVGLPAAQFVAEPRPVSDQRVGPGEVELQVTMAPDIELGGRSVMAVQIRRDHQVLRELQVSVEVKRWMEVPVLTSRLRRGELVGPAHLSYQRRLLAGREETLGALDEVVGMRSRRSLSSGHLLLAADLEPLPLVFRGETVQMLLTRGAIQVEMRGVALADGWLGDHVRVRNPLTRKTIRATVCGAGQVRFEQ